MLFELLHICKGITSIIGSGGKSTLLTTLAEELPGRVILTTTTHMLVPAGYPLILTDPDMARDDAASLIRSAFAVSRIICIGSAGPDNKLSPPAYDLSCFSEMADYILVEADGSKMLPVKAHALWEPVIHPDTRLTICVVGASGFYRPLISVCHRSDIFCRLAEMETDGIVTPALAAKVVEKEKLCDIIFLNQTDLLPDRGPVYEFIHNTNIPVVAGSLHRREYYI